MALSTRRGGRARFTLILLILTSITLLTLDFRGFAPLNTVRSAVLDAFQPVGDFASDTLEPVSDAWNGAFDYDAVEKENEELRRRVDELEGQITSGEVAKQSLQQLLEQAGVLRVQRYGDEAEGATLEPAGVELDIAAEGEPVGGDGHRVGAPVADHREVDVHRAVEPELEGDDRPLRGRQLSDPLEHEAVQVEPAGGEQGRVRGDQGVARRDRHLRGWGQARFGTGAGTVRGGRSVCRGVGRFQRRRVAGLR